MLKREEEEAERRLNKACPGLQGLGTRVVLLAAMNAAAEITHECGTPEATDDAVIETFFDAVQSVD